MFLVYARLCMGMERNMDKGEARRLSPALVFHPYLSSNPHVVHQYRLTFPSLLGIHPSIVRRIVTNPSLAILPVKHPNRNLPPFASLVRREKKNVSIYGHGSGHVGERTVEKKEAGWDDWMSNTFMPNRIERTWPRWKKRSSACPNRFVP